MVARAPYAEKFSYVVTAIVNVGGGNYLSIAPNPAKDFIVIRYNLPGNITASVELYDLNGKKVLTKNNVKDGDQVNLMQLAGGMYVLKIYNSNGRMIGSTKIIKLW